MNKKRRFAFTAILTITTLIFFACGMTEPYLAPEAAEEFQVQEIEGIIVKCKALTQPEIKRRHGARTNPFLPPPMMITPKQMIIYELEITNNDSAPLKMDIRDITLYYNEADIIPMSPKDMDDKITDYSESKLKEKRIAKEFMFSNVEIIDGNSTVKGYIIFMATLRTGIDAEFVTGFRTIDNDDAGSVSFKYNYARLKK